MSLIKAKKEMTYSILVEGQEDRFLFDADLKSLYRLYDRYHDQNLFIWKPYWKEWVSFRDSPLFHMLTSEVSNEASSSFEDILSLCAFNSKRTPPSTAEMFSFFKDPQHTLQGEFNLDSEALTWTFKPKEPQSYMSLGLRGYSRIEYILYCESPVHLFLQCHQTPAQKEDFLQSSDFQDPQNALHLFPANQWIKMCIDTKRQKIEIRDATQSVVIKTHYQLQHLLYLYFQSNGTELIFSKLSLGEIPTEIEDQWPIPAHKEELQTLGKEWTRILKSPAHFDGFFMVVEESELYPLGLILTSGFQKIYGSFHTDSYAFHPSMVPFDLAYLGPAWQDQWLDWADHLIQSNPRSFLCDFQLCFPHDSPRDRLDSVSDSPTMQQALLEAYDDYQHYICSSQEGKFHLLQEWILEEKEWSIAQELFCRYAQALTTYVEAFKQLGHSWDYAQFLDKTQSHQGTIIIREPKRVDVDLSDLLKP